MEFDSFARFAQFLERAGARLPREIEQALDKTGKSAARLAYNKIATYQADYVTPEGFFFPAWEPLSYNTLYGGESAGGFTYPGKVQLGYAPPDNPLLRTGELRNSISYTLHGGWRANELVLGSDSQVAVWMEHGTPTIPPRPFIGPALAETVQHVGLPLLRDAVLKALGQI